MRTANCKKIQQDYAESQCTLLRVKARLLRSITLPDALSVCCTVFVFSCGTESEVSVCSAVLCASAVCEVFSVSLEGMLRCVPLREERLEERDEREEDAREEDDLLLDSVLLLLLLLLLFLDLLLLLSLFLLLLLLLVLLLLLFDLLERSCSEREDDDFSDL